MERLLHRAPSTFKALASVSCASEATVWTPAAGKKFRLLRYALTCDVAGDYVFKDGTGGTTILVYRCAVNGFGYADLGDVGLLSATQGNVLTVTGPVSSHISGILMGDEPPGSDTF